MSTEKKEIQLKDYIGKEVYMAGSGPECEMSLPLVLTTTKYDLRKFVENVTPDIDYDMNIVHGVFTSAVSLPLELPEDTNIYLIIKEASYELDSYILKVETLAELVEVIAWLVKDEYSLDEDESIPDDIVDYMHDIEQQNIEELFVLYGESLEITYTCGTNEAAHVKVQEWKSAFDKIKEMQR